MEHKELLSEEKYQNTKNKISKLALIVLAIGLVIGGFLIYNGVKSPSSKSIDELTMMLESKKAQLESKGIKYNPTAKYTDGEAYDLKVITNALDPSFRHCVFEEYSENSITKEYCAVKNKSTSFSNRTSIIGGVSVIFTTFMISGLILFISKRREILAFSTQQVMPVAQEGMKKMAPSFGEVAKEIAKGIKEGNEDNK